MEESGVGDYTHPIIADIKNGSLVEKNISIDEKQTRKHYYIIAATKHEIPFGGLHNPEIDVV